MNAARENGWSINAMAQASGVPQPVLQRFLEGGQDDIKLATADKLCQHFGMRLTLPRKNTKPL